MMEITVTLLKQACFSSDLLLSQLRWQAVSVEIRTQDAGTASDVSEHYFDSDGTNSSDDGKCRT